MIVRRPWNPPVDDEVRQLFHDEGLSLVGIADATPAAEESREYKRWIEGGHHGDMSYLRDHALKKYDPHRIMEGAQSVLVAALNYYQKPPDAEAGKRSQVSGRVARYAWGRDYHKELGKRLRRIAKRLGERYQGEQFRSFVDATPLAERHYAERSGVGFTGRHTLLISGQFGSWFFVGEILSTRRFPPTGPAEQRHGACPRGCRKCIDVCPTGALLAPYRIDAKKCISYLTIEYDGVIPLEIQPAMGNWLFGCDLCQEVCPLNVRAKVTDVEAFLNPIAGDRLLLGEILNIESDDQFVRRFAGSPLMRAKRRRLVRNACVVAANENARELLPRLRELAGDSDPVIAEQARSSLNRMDQNAGKF